jgi:Uncharacterized protein conserved in bacteria (DUF2066)
VRLILIPVLLATLGFAWAASGAAVLLPASDAVELFTVSGIKVDATASSPRAARDLAMRQGQRLAWSKLFRRFTVQSAWGSQPQLADDRLRGLIRSVELANERHSSTRYLAELVFHFNGSAVRQLLRSSDIAFTDTRSKPALIIPLIAGTARFDPLGLWALAWTKPSLQQGLVPTELPGGDITDLPAAATLVTMDWAALGPLVSRYNVGQVILAIASEDAKTLQMIKISPTGRTVSSFAFAGSTFAADAEAIAEHAADEWRLSVDRQRVASEQEPKSLADDNAHAHLTADVRFRGLKAWATLRAHLGAVKAIREMDVVGLALSEAEIGLTYSGRIEQLRAALAQQDLELSDSGGEYTLELRADLAANPH